MRNLSSFVVILLAGCATAQQSGAVIERPSRDWRLIATPDDRDRLRDWRGAFVEGLREAKAAGHDVDITREGKLLYPDAALGGGPIPNGNYKCRVIKLGGKSPGLLDYIAYPAFRCRVGANAGLQSFDKLSGSQRHTGRIFADSALRQAFLGTLVLGDETRAMQYGRDQDRDVAGWIERVGDNRWRLILPYPHFESTLDVVELVPEQ